MEDDFSQNLLDSVVNSNYLLTKEILSKNENINLMEIKDEKQFSGKFINNMQILT
jgi:hypothetical protein